MRIYTKNWPCDRGIFILHDSWVGYLTEKLHFSSMNSPIQWYKPYTLHNTARNLACMSVHTKFTCVPGVLSRQLRARSLFSITVCSSLGCKSWSNVLTMSFLNSSNWSLICFTYMYNHGLNSHRGAYVHIRARKCMTLATWGFATICFLNWWGAYFRPRSIAVA